MSNSDVPTVLDGIREAAEGVRRERARVEELLPDRAEQQIRLEKLRDLEKRLCGDLAELEENAACFLGERDGLERELQDLPQLRTTEEIHADLEELGLEFARIRESARICQGIRGALEAALENLQGLPGQSEIAECLDNLKGLLTSRGDRRSRRAALETRQVELEARRIRLDSELVELTGKIADLRDSHGSEVDEFRSLGRVLVEMELKHEELNGEESRIRLLTEELRTRKEAEGWPAEVRRLKSAVSEQEGKLEGYNTELEGMCAALADHRARLNTIEKASVPVIEQAEQFLKIRKSLLRQLEQVDDEIPLADLGQENQETTRDRLIQAVKYAVETVRSEDDTARNRRRRANRG